MPPVVPVTEYQRALDFLGNLDISAMKLGLSRMEAVLDGLDNPQDSLPMIHVAGTNGKGSVCAMLTAVLKAAGYKVGTFTSPHLVDVRERIALNGQPIPEADFAREVFELEEFLQTFTPHPNAHQGESDPYGSSLADGSRFPPQGGRGLSYDYPTYFEVLNILAYRYFQREEVDITVFEVGLGGRLDSTNIVERPDVTVITGIDYDHRERLGNTLAEIASEKAGIIKPGSPLVLGPNIPDEARVVILEKAEATQIWPLQAEPGGLEPEGFDAEKGVQKIYHSRWGEHFELSLLGRYQKNNLSTVLAVIETLRERGWEIPTDAIHQGLSQVSWPARFQYFPEKKLVIDGGHNPQGFAALKESVQTYFPDIPLVWLLSLRNNRNPEDLLKVVLSFERTQGIIWTAAEKPELYHDPVIMKAKTQVLQPGLRVEAEPETPQAFALLQQWQGEADIAITTGSLYTAGELLRLI